LIENRPDWIRISDGRYKPIDDERHPIEAAKELFESGMLGTKVAEQLGITYGTFRYWKRIGFKFKDPQNPIYRKYRMKGESE
jgi:uncharacterized protein YjcR